MKAKNALLTILSILVWQFALCQNSDDESYSRSAGIDANFINTFLPLDNPIGLRGPYLLHYIKYKEDNKFTKHAFDMSLFGNFESNESEIDQDIARFNIGYKIGKGKRKSAFNKGYFLYGMEWSLGYFMNRRSNADPNDPVGESLNMNFDQSFSSSLGPVLGFGYNVSKRISLYTEAGFYFNFRYNIEKFNSEFSPSLDFRDTSIGLSTSFVVPRSIIVFYHF